MNVSLRRSLEESVSLTRRLLVLMKEDEEDMYHCVSGEILSEYLNCAEHARAYTQLLLRELEQLLARQVISG